ELTRDDLKVNADRLTYNDLTDEVTVEGRVRIEQGGDVVRSERGRLVMYEKTGEFVSPEYEFTTQSVSKVTGAERTIVARGDASQLRFEGENQYVLENATWTTCKPESSDWYIK